MKKLILLSILASAFSASAFATPNLVANASFEDYALPAGTTTDVSAATAGIYLPSWSIVGPENVQLVTSTYASPPYNLSASDGVQWVDLTGMSEGLGKGVSNSITTIAGQQYSLSFDVGTLTDRNAATVAVSINGGAAQNFTNLNVNTDYSMNWAQESMTFTAASDSTSLSFTGAANPYQTNTTLIGLDKVSVTAVPEPGTYGMMLGGLGLLGFMVYRRSNSFNS